MEIVNLTPHAVTLVGSDGQTVTTIQPSGTEARVSMTRAVVGTVEVVGVEFPVNQARLGDIVGLPEPQPGVYYLVSRVIAEAASNRDDLLITDEAVRDGQGRIVGCRAFARI